MITDGPKLIHGIIVNENDTGGLCILSLQHNMETERLMIDMQFDLPTLLLISPPNSTADRTVAHEMVHLMQAQNSYYGNIVGDGDASHR